MKKILFGLMATVCIVNVILGDNSRLFGVNNHESLLFVPPQPSTSISQQRPTLSTAPSKAQNSNRETHPTAITTQVEDRIGKLKFLPAPQKDYLAPMPPVIDSYLTKKINETIVFAILPQKC